MKTVKVYGFTKQAKKDLLHIGIDNFKGTSCTTTEESKETKYKMGLIKFPCEMEITGMTDIGYKDIVRDANGNLWSIAHLMV